MSDIVFSDQPSEIRSLLEDMMKAFKAINRPSPEAIVGPIQPMDFEREEAKELLQNLTWEDLIRSDDVPIPTFLTPQAWHYFLPGYLIRGLLSHPSYFLIREICLYWPSYPGMREFAEKRLQLLTPDQRSVIKQYVFVARSNGQKDAVEAWEKHWSGVL